jgi:hypothetical protein
MAASRLLVRRGQVVLLLNSRPLYRDVYGPVTMSDSPKEQEATAAGPAEQDTTGRASGVAASVGAEVVALFEVDDEPGVGRLPVEQLSGLRVGHRDVHRDEREALEVVRGLLGRNAHGRDAQLTAPDLTRRRDELLRCRLAAAGVPVLFCSGRARVVAERP